VPSFDLEWRHPKLKRENYRITSDHSIRYNCVAWALGENRRWYQVGSEPHWYWPAGVPKDGTFESYVALFTRIGFSPCDSAEWEAGYEKVALYADDEGVFKHVAKMKDAETWMSKVGSLDDIEHRTLDVFDSDRLGTVRQVLRRPIQGEQGDAAGENSPEFIVRS
jgi:hypothetical protein